MLDLETFGTAPGSAILAIGAVKFGANKVHSEFYQRVALHTCIKAGLTMDASTVLWWLQQAEEARLEITKPGMGLATALNEFDHWVYRDELVGSEIEMWGNGASFDNVLLSVAYEKTGMSRPWAYWNDRCYRTVKNLFPNVELVRDGTHHNALDDARSQALHLMNMLPNL